MSKKKEIDRHNSQEFCPKSIIEDMKWFPFQGSMLHAVDNMECPSDNLKSLLKVLPMFKINIIYDKTIDNEYVLEDVGIMFINCGKSIGCQLGNQNLELFITPFVTNIVFQNIGLFWIIKSNKDLNFDFQKQCTS